jgi:long-chain acyl-CoA synthetase
MPTTCCIAATRRPSSAWYSSSRGTSVALALHAADRIQQTLGLPNAAFSYLRSHGTLDQQHTMHLARLLERMAPADQADVVHSARVFYKLYGDVFRALPCVEEATCS